MSSGWQTFWFLVTALALVSYFGLSVVIAIGGAFDVRKMFQRLSAAHESDLQSASSPEQSGEEDGTIDSPR
jgi:hypothetical protein